MLSFAISWFSLGVIGVAFLVLANKRACREYGEVFSITNGDAFIGGVLILVGPCGLLLGFAGAGSILIELPSVKDFWQRPFRLTRRKDQ